MHRTWLLVALLSIVVGWSGGSATAQPSIPNGVFVRDADRNLFLVLDGKRHRVPVYPLYPDEVEAIPESGQWVVPGEDGGIEIGAYPHWERHPEVMPGQQPGLFPARP